MNRGTMLAALAATDRNLHPLGGAGDTIRRRNAPRLVAPNLVHRPVHERQENTRVRSLRTHDHSTMGIAYTGTASTNFDVSGKTQTGLSDLQVIANGIASLPVTVNIE
jgi:hypothetical protein